ncbi:MAG: hypothetical protein Q7R56_00510 [Nanoarchaeota archaeon]|nr:hypothetical protein [Nanoarchaeota archaeon]
MKRTTLYPTITAISFFIFIITYSITKKDYYYIFDSIKFIIITLLIYHYHNKLHLTPFTYAFLLIVMILHDLGRFGAFNWDILNLPWDVITHFLASYAITLALYQALPQLTGFWGKLIIILASIGIATLGEFVEFAGATQTPNGQGILGVESRGSPIPWLSPDYWDTMKDLVLNTLGTIIATIHHLLRNVYKSSRTLEKKDNYGTRTQTIKH